MANAAECDRRSAKPKVRRGGSAPSLSRTLALIRGGGTRVTEWASIRYSIVVTEEASSTAIRPQSYPAPK